MKNLLLTIALCLSFVCVFGQITITKDDFGNAGDTVRMSVSADLQVDFLTTGANQNWDYSQLVPESQYLKEYSDISDAGTFANFLFGQFASPMYQASYFNESNAVPLDQISQFLPLPIESFNLVSRLTEDSLTSIGSIISVSGNLIPVKSDTIETRYDFPLNFGNTHFSRGYTYLNMNPIQNSIWIQHRTRNTEVDGWGTITTPFGTFSALRVRHDITEYDSLFLEVSGIGFWVPVPVPLSHEYEWWTNGQKEPILKITTNQVQGNENVASVEYRDIYRGLDAGLLEHTVEVNLFPNPTAGKVLVKASSPLNSITILDLNGKVMFKQFNLKQNMVEIDLQDFPVGSYLVEGRTVKGAFQAKLIRD